MPHHHVHTKPFFFLHLHMSPAVKNPSTGLFHCALYHYDSNHHCQRDAPLCDAGKEENRENWGGPANGRADACRNRLAAAPMDGSKVTIAHRGRLGFQARGQGKCDLAPKDIIHFQWTMATTKAYLKKHNRPINTCSNLCIPALLFSRETWRLSAFSLAGCLLTKGAHGNSGRPLSFNLTAAALILFSIFFLLVAKVRYRHVEGLQRWGRVKMFPSVHSCNRAVAPQSSPWSLVSPKNGPCFHANISLAASSSWPR